MTDTFQWERCAADGTGCADIADATASSYTLTADDVGHTIRVRGSRDGVLVGESAATAVVAETAPPSDSPFALPDGKFPISVWFQDPSQIASYAAIGITCYSWLGGTPTQSIMNQLKAHGMFLIAASRDQAAVLALADQSALWAWSYEIDEPDDAQPPGYTQCIPPATVAARLQAIKAADPRRRPVYLGLGECVGDPTLPDRGQSAEPDRTAAAERDFPIYAKYADIVRFDFYPINHSYTFTKVADGCDRLKRWAPGKVRCLTLETTKIETDQGTPTPAQTRCETWMALIHGANMIEYFCHVNPGEAGGENAALVTDPAYASMKNQVALTNAQVQRLKEPLLVGDTPGVAALSGNSQRIDLCVRDVGGTRYLFAVNTSASTSAATFTVAGAGDGSVSVIDEARNVAMVGGVFSDSFAAYAVHLYQLP